MKNLIGCSFFIFLISCGSPGNEVTSTELMDTLSMARHIEVLASDAFEGRKPFTAGEVKTLEYLKNAFTEYGLEPGNGTDYFQAVPMVELDARPSAELLFSGNDQQVSLKVSEDFVAYSERVSALNVLENSPVVFAGYGIVAPEYNWNDYRDLDVKGKTVIVLVNDPGFGSGDSTFFKGQTMTYYGRWTYKYEEAARQGAAAILIVHDTAPAGYPWLVVRNSWSGASLYLDQTGANFQPIVQGWMTRDAAIRVFEASDVDMRNYVERSRSKEFKAQALGLTASIGVENGIKKDVSQNVIAKITGTVRPDEYIIYTAHWDHLGIGPEVDGDSIYNGALDNASGVSLLLTLAERFAKGPQPERTILFLAVTAEEQGLLGSKYYAENPLYPLNKTVAVINMDEMGNSGPMKDLTVVGYGQSELDELIGDLAKGQGRYVMPDPEPEKGYFFRSDHFQFARVGVPAIYAYGKYESMDPKKGVAFIEEQVRDYQTNRYHRPADQFDESWRFGGMLQDAKLFHELGLQLANSKLWPQWKATSEFKSIREASMN